MCSSSTPSPIPSPIPKTPTLYFAYGSNLSRTQMETRCPNSTYYGLGVLHGYQWIINERGYANIISDSDSNPHSKTSSASDSGSASSPALLGIDTLEGKATGSEIKKEQERKEQCTKKSKPHNKVYGILYTLTPADESALDIDEGVPFAYTKTHLPITLITLSSSSYSSPTSLSSPSKIVSPSASKVGKDVQALTYIDLHRTTPSTPNPEYIHRMNRGIWDAVSKGMEMSYVRDVMRVYIPEEGEGSEDWLRDGGDKKRGRRFGWVQWR